MGNIGTYLILGVFHNSYATISSLLFSDRPRLWNTLRANKGKTLKITNIQRALDRNFRNFRFRIVGLFLSSLLMKGTVN